MKKKMVVAAVRVLLTGLLVVGCGQKSEVWDAAENSIYITKEHEVSSAMVYIAEKPNELYDQAELAEFVKDAVVAYNTQAGAASLSENPESGERLPVALKSCTLEGQQGRLVFDYQTPEDFVTFSKENRDNTHTITSLRVRTVADEMAVGKLPDVGFKDLQGKTLTKAEVTEKPEYSIAVVEGSGTVYTESKLLYVSENVVVKDDHAVMTAEGTNVIIFKK